MAKTADKPDAIISSEFGYLGIWANHQGLYRLQLLTGAPKTYAGKSPPVKQVVRQLQSYFDDGGFRFDLPLVEQGTPFQKSVWQQLRRIPSGQTVNYLDLAKKLGTSPRAVGAACRANPVPIVTPCHRVVAKQGIGGFMGQTEGAPVKMKQWLIQHERRL